MRLAFVCLVLVLAGGCAQDVYEEPRVSETSLFGATAMRIHPIFTEVKDWDNDGKPDGIEALVEFQDQFGDPTKAAGTVMFELYSYRQANPDPRGQRLVNPWIGSITSVAEQQSRWNRTSRTYTFQLSYPEIRQDRNYVLTATFRPITTGGRFHDRIVLPADQEKPGATTDSDDGQPASSQP